MTMRMTLGSITLDSSEARVHPWKLKISKWLKSRIQATTCLRVMGHGGDYRTDMHPHWKFSKKLRQLNATRIFCSLVTGTFGWTERDLQKRMWNMNCRSGHLGLMYLFGLDTKEYAKKCSKKNELPGTQQILQDKLSFFGKKFIHFGMIQLLSGSYNVMCSMSVCPPQSWCAF